jgi:lipoprotein-anchoring transpeptidase ErfK/SrfK
LIGFGYLIVIRRARFDLDLYRRFPATRTWKLHRRYPIAVGMDGLETPPGMYEIQHKSKHPDYTYPDSEWVRELGVEPGTVIEADDPANPVAPRWIGISDQKQIGIHGTNRPESIGTQASHGCVRLRPADILQLYRVVPKGTPVFVY